MDHDVAVGRPIGTQISLSTLGAAGTVGKNNDREGPAALADRIINRERDARFRAASRKTRLSRTPNRSLVAITASWAKLLKKMKNKRNIQVGIKTLRERKIIFSEEAWRRLGPREKPVPLETAGGIG